MKRALAALLLAAACGTGTDGKPVAPPTTPEPPAGPPTVQAVAALWSKPAIGDGYSVGERIRVVLDFELHTTTVEGSPRLAIQIGEHVRLADFSPWVEDDFPPERPSRLQRFEYWVGLLDQDQDGISIEADALDFSDGAIRGRGGGEIQVEIRAVNPQSRGHNLARPGDALDTHRVIGPPEPRVCTDERQRALERYTRPVLLDEWDGTPFRFYFRCGDSRERAGGRGALLRSRGAAVGADRRAARIFDPRSGGVDSRSRARVPNRPRGRGGLRGGAAGGDSSPP